MSEFIGTALLVCVVVGSGIMGESLSKDSGVALLINAFSTIFALALLILMLEPISGAQFNPVVSLVQLLDRQQKPTESIFYVVVQILGAISGALLANLMFDLPVINFSDHARVSQGKLIGEVIATAGLISVIGILSLQKKSQLIPIAVAGWIGSAYFFTSSTSFANPAVTVGRMFSDTFAGIAPSSVLPYIAAQLIGVGIGMALVRNMRRSNV